MNKNGTGPESLVGKQSYPVGNLIVQKDKTFQENEEKYTYFLTFSCNKPIFSYESEIPLYALSPCRSF